MGIQSKGSIVLKVASCQEESDKHQPEPVTLQQSLTFSRIVDLVDSLLVLCLT